ncbi:ring finger domain-containing protein [Moniliophthora roreri MCA 2997]|uniref:Ring finger domain-containing protein n=2 Tax=Moniliophthora roreri TaxID=221103 RepID=V2XBD2_MONRO|nr:ring finger domain-containing protein [Moniliophthora roreri MCA 2997]KAI3596964.1 ring finger domain-containing protein [Moniliophthora roreri]
MASAQPARRSTSSRRLLSETQAVTRSIGKGSDPSSKNKGKSTAKIIDVIEISSDEDEPVVPLKRKKEVFVEGQRDLERQLKKLKEENEGLKKKQLESDKEIERFKQELRLKQANSTSATLPISDLEDHISCEICTLKLWTPYILPDCGHTFCQSCLQDWFNTTHNQHFAQPQNDPYAHLPAHVRLMVQQDPGLANYVAVQLPPPPRPPVQYTCPTCRTDVRHRPVEDFVLKAVVRTVAQAQGESSPKKAPVTKGRGRVPPVPEDPWGKFFPRT